MNVEYTDENHHLGFQLPRIHGELHGRVLDFTFFGASCACKADTFGWRLNWLPAGPERGFLTILRLYGETRIALARGGASSAG